MRCARNANCAAVSVKHCDLAAQQLLIKRLIVAFHLYARTLSAQSTQLFAQASCKDFFPSFIRR